jgi:hypothetical protein
VRQPDRCQVLGGEEGWAWGPGAGLAGRQAPGASSQRGRGMGRGPSRGPGSPDRPLRPPGPRMDRRWCATSTAWTPRAPTMATATCSWSGSTCTSTRQPAVRRGRQGDWGVAHQPTAGARAARRVQPGGQQNLNRMAPAAGLHRQPGLLPGPSSAQGRARGPGAPIQPCSRPAGASVRRHRRCCVEGPRLSGTARLLLSTAPP